jgi:flavodoxin
MKTAIIYRSFLGTTKKYAEWLHGEVESDIFRPGQLSKARLAEYDLVISVPAPTRGGLACGVG